MIFPLPWAEKRNDDSSDESFHPEEYGDDTDTDTDDDTYYDDRDKDDADDDEDDSGNFNLRVDGAGDGNLNNERGGTRSDESGTKKSQDFKNFPGGPSPQTTVTGPVVAAVFSTATIFLLCLVAGFFPN